MLRQGTAYGATQEYGMSWLETPAEDVHQMAGNKATIDSVSVCDLDSTGLGVNVEEKNLETLPQTNLNGGTLPRHDHGSSDQVTLSGNLSALAGDIGSLGLK